MQISDIGGQHARQFIDLGTAFLLSAAIGLEREIRHKSDGLRTYTLVGTSAALFLRRVALPPQPKGFKEEMNQAVDR